jgi:hypothetical protein
LTGLSERPLDEAEDRLGVWRERGRVGRFMAQKREGATGVLSSSNGLSWISSWRALLGDVRSRRVGVVEDGGGVGMSWYSFVSVRREATGLAVVMDGVLLLMVESQPSMKASRVALAGEFMSAKDTESNKS